MPMSRWAMAAGRRTWSRQHRAAQAPDLDRDGRRRQALSGTTRTGERRRRVAAPARARPRCMARGRRGLSSAHPQIAAVDGAVRQFRVGPILLQKSPQKFCETRISNNRIEAGKFLNQCCASTPDLESILRAQMGKIFLQQNRPEAVVLRCNQYPSTRSPRRR